METVSFSVFADLHYKKGMYAASIADVNSIFERADREGASFVLQLGDMCNDYIRSQELVNAYLHNKQGLDVFGVYGNHELESVGNTMEYVTPLLTNRGESVVWGTDSGKIEDGSIAYYYFDVRGFRFVCLDSNYSLNPIKTEYEHNLPASWGEPEGNLYPNSLGDRQMAWLRKVLLESAKEGKSCIISAHSSFSGLWQKCNDAEKIRKIYKEANQINPKTVILSLNGHLHSDNSAVIDDVVYLDINTVRSGWWQSIPFDPYKEADIKQPKYTFEFTDYDQGGNPSISFDRPLSSLTMGGQTLFFADPLSALITVGTDGSVTLKGSKTEWMYGIEPDSARKKELLCISDFEYNKTNKTP